jgi:hypothetical protein
MGTEWNITANNDFGSRRVGVLCRSYHAGRKPGFVCGMPALQARLPEVWAVLHVWAQLRAEVVICCQF